ncbi:cyclic nucleotide-gated channel rod photoreceptor subunit alpha-like [Mytilus californianus]|uniref:cyclic nucleotide-gated channel rod photoreceptor subunit alpha-like n=1 Tax=Mytilus californianus TaxID=6549 RepID=UPI0022471896|nr:cyclic nucleotide-gated channel rod photoreceptor subunit alpha-like [Mytilus californianus]
MSSSAAKGKGNEPSVAVKYIPCSKGDTEHTDDELEEIAIMGNDKHDNKKSETKEFGKPTANGPHILSGGVGIFQVINTRDRTMSIGERLSKGGRISLSSPVYSNKVVEQKSRSTSKQSLMDLFGSRIDRSKSRAKSFSARGDLSLMKKVRSSEVMTPREIRKLRKKDIESKFGKKSKIVKTERLETTTTLSDHEGCNWTFVFDPSGRLAYWWSSVVSLAFLYNFWVIIYRYAFHEIDTENYGVWFALDYTADLLYILDIVFHFRTGYLDDGVLQTDAIKLRIHYMNTTMFYIDCLCLLPLDFLYLSIGFCSILRCFRLVKVYRYWAFLDRTERHTNYPNAMRTLTLMHYLLALFHWNACLYNIVATHENASSTWTMPKDDGSTVKKYLHALYWSTLTLTTFGNLPRPLTVSDYSFIIFEMIFGLLLFATVLGHISNIVANISAARKDFQAKLDGVKTYMSLRRVPMRLQDRVIKWFDYLWYCNKSTDEERTLSLLPDKLKAEIAIHVHLDTLKRVEIFQNTESGFLCELVLRLKPVLFSPGDYICRKGEVGKEMYIVNRGRLHVVADNGKTVLATLKPGSYFGEISILNMGTSGNRRTASVRSVGYSDLFRLSKQDLWDVLKEYPTARVKLEAIAVKRLEKTKKMPLEKAAMSRSKSTPGLVESQGKVPLEAMFMTRHHTLPAGLPIQKVAPEAQTQNHEGESDGNNLELTECQPAEMLPPNTPVQEQNTGILSKSQTVSSMKSFTVPSPSHKSTSFSDAKFTISPPTSPRDIQQADIPSTISAQLSPVHFPFPQMYSYQTTQQSPMNLLSPYCASNTLHMPSSQSLALTRSDNLASSQNNLSSPQNQTYQSPFYQTQHSVVSISPGITSNVPSGSPASFSYETSQDVLLQEITTLRERLATLEAENSTMTAKLNQQQWDVENRLSELEMHMCPSSSIASTTSQDDRPERLEPVNRESII